MVPTSYNNLLLFYYRVAHARYYDNVKQSATAGQKNQIQLLVDGKNAEHDVNGLFQYLSKIVHTLGLYSEQGKKSAFFTANIEKAENLQLFFDTKLNEKYQVKTIK